MLCHVESLCHIGVDHFEDCVSLLALKARHSTITLFLPLALSTFFSHWKAISFLKKVSFFFLASFQSWPIELPSHQAFRPLRDFIKANGKNLFCNKYLYKRTNYPFLKIFCYRYAHVQNALH